MGHVKTAKENEIERNRQAFEARLPALVGSHRGEFALLRHLEVIGFYPDAMAAQEAGDAAYADADFSIQLVTDEPAGLGYLSYVLYNRQP